MSGKAGRKGREKEGKGYEGRGKLAVETSSQFQGPPGTIECQSTGFC